MLRPPRIGLSRTRVRRFLSSILAITTVFVLGAGPSGAESRANKHPIVLVRGANHTNEAFRAIESKLANKGHGVFRLTPPDFAARNAGAGRFLRHLVSTRLGHPESDFVRKLDRELRDIHQQTGQKPIIVGHSMGGRHVQRLLLRKQKEGDAPITDVIAGAIIAAGVPPSGILPAIVKWFPKAPKEVLRALAGRLSENREFASELFLGDPKRRAELPPLVPESIRALWSLALPLAAPQGKKQGRVPMLILAAQKDALFPPKGQKKMAQAWGAEFKMIQNAPHDLFLPGNPRDADSKSDPEGDFVKHILDFSESIETLPVH